MEEPVEKWPHIELSWGLDVMRLVMAMRHIYVFAKYGQPDTGYNVGSLPLHREMCQHFQDKYPLVLQSEPWAAIPPRFQAAVIKFA